MSVQTLRALLADDEGATMVEYSIMAALVAAVCIAVVTTLGKDVKSMFSGVNTGL
jgi:pilus assembly protein Flp/PilA